MHLRGATKANRIVAHPKETGPVAFRMGANSRQTSGHECSECHKHGSCAWPLFFFAGKQTCCAETRPMKAARHSRAVHGKAGLLDQDVWYHRRARITDAARPNFFPSIKCRVYSLAFHKEFNPTSTSAKAPWHPTVKQQQVAPSGPQHQPGQP